MLFIEYPKCGTCRKARRFLEARGAQFQARDIQRDRPTMEELSAWQRRSGLPLKRFFNTSGTRYREMSLKEKLPEMDEAAQLELLASDGMLVKRPLLIGEDFVLVGFREAEWECAADRNSLSS